MQADNLVRMANQIAHFFAPYPETDAIEGVRGHLVNFWDPAMRQELLSIASGLTPTSAPLDALVLRAVTQLRGAVDEKSTRAMQRTRPRTMADTPTVASTPVQPAHRVHRHALLDILMWRTDFPPPCIAHHHHHLPMPHRSVALSALLVAASVLGAQPAPDRRIQAVMDRPEFKHAIWGMEFYDLDTKRPIAGVNAERLFTPGSTTKLLTMGTALEVLGAEHRFRTPVYRTGRLRNGVLDGDLVLVASGDPNVSGRARSDGSYAFIDKDHSYGGAPLTTDPLATLRLLAAQVAATGIRAITGQVIVDASLFAEADRELGTRVMLSPMMVNDNVIDIVLTPGARAGDPVTVSVSPKTGYLSVQARVTTGDSAAPARLTSQEDSTNVDHRVLVITGSIPRGEAVNARWAVASPRRAGEILFSEVLNEAGVRVIPRLGARAINVAALRALYAESLMVAEHVSLPLVAEATVLLKTSQNLHASNFPLLLGALPASLRGGKNGFDLAHDWLQREGLDLDGAVQGDGAGGDAMFAPAFMTRYLAVVAAKPWGPAFARALPVLGTDGTLATIQVGSAGAGKVFAKTGTFSKYDPLNRRMLVTAKGLAGYFTSKSGKRIAFAIYVNNLSVSTGDPAIVAGQALGEIASLAWERIR